MFVKCTKFNSVKLPILPPNVHAKVLGIYYKHCVAEKCTFINFFPVSQQADVEAAPLRHPPALGPLAPLTIIKCGHTKPQILSLADHTGGIPTIMVSAVNHDQVPSTSTVTKYHDQVPSTSTMTKYHDQVP